MLRQKSNLGVGFYELGSEYQDGARYPAANLDFLTVLGAKVSAGNAFTFGESVKQGIAELKNYVSSVSISCPHTKFVVAGYSQGAMIITSGLDELDSNKFIYAATFGDPKLYLPEGRGGTPDACLGKNLSPYRIYAPNCRTYQGSLSAKIPYLENGWLNKVGLWCKNQDLVCGAGFSFGEPKTQNNLLGDIVQSALHAHTRYPDDGVYELAAKTIVEKIRSNYPDNFRDEYIVANNQDTVILLDTSGSMYGYMDYHRKIASKIAEETIKLGGRVSLWTYGNLAFRKPEQVIGFTSDFNEFSSYLWSIGSRLDSRETSYLSAVKNILDTAEWKLGSVKSIVTLTLSDLKSPDLDGTTEEMVKRSTVLNEPVELYTISAFEDVAEKYIKFTRGTGGDSFWDINVENIDIPDHFFMRPNLKFSFSSYSGEPGETFNFEVSTTSTTVKYEWDLDGDNIFETATDTCTVSKTYQADFTGYIRVKATDENGYYSIALAYLEISPNIPTEPKISNLKVIQKGTSVSISYTLDENTVGALISLDDAMLGLTSDENLEITDVTKTSTLTITPLSFDGILGTPIRGEITYKELSDKLPLTPQTGYR